MTVPVLIVRWWECPNGCIFEVRDEWAKLYDYKRPTCEAEMVEEEAAK